VGIAGAAVIALVACVSLIPLATQAGNGKLVIDALPEEPVDQQNAQAVDETMPRILPEHFARPEYPERARRDGIEGMVVVEVLVRKDGTPGEQIVAVEEIADYPEFTEKTFEAVRRWRFEPGTIAGEPADMQVTIPVKFKLDDCDSPTKKSKQQDS
jgi:protein TonB